MEVRKAIEITGIVQGVGFRPYVFRLARERSLAGHIENTAAGVAVEVQGEAEQVAGFLASLPREVPPLARISDIRVRDRPCNGDRAFSILPSRAAGQRQALIAPDVAICDDCLRELLDPADRRYLYPLINCTNCGPRFTIVRGVPYDRARTSMAAFPMCPECQAEYDDPASRRFHAQPNACWTCGPRAELWDTAGRRITVKDPVAEAAARFGAGAIVAVKGLGGFHLACDAASPAAVEELRRRKGRGEKPFAVMFASLAEIQQRCVVAPEAQALLLDPARPIVLLPARAGSRMAPAVAPGLSTLGALLPYTPLHHVLFAAGAEAWSYDALGRVLANRRTTNSVTKVFSYQYNLDGSVWKITYPTGRTITYSYNAAARALSAVDAAAGVNYALNASYAPHGALASVLHGQAGVLSRFL